jgi:hypothetical protein
LGHSIILCPTISDVDKTAWRDKVAPNKVATGMTRLNNLDRKYRDGAIARAILCNNSVMLAYPRPHQSAPNCHGYSDSEGLDGEGIHEAKSCKVADGETTGPSLNSFSEPPYMTQVSDHISALDDMPLDQSHIPKPITPNATATTTPTATTTATTIATDITKSLPTESASANVALILLFPCLIVKYLCPLQLLQNWLSHLATQSARIYLHRYKLFHRYPTPLIKSKHATPSTPTRIFGQTTSSLLSGCPSDSVLFDSAESARINHAYDPCATAFDNIFTNYCSVENPFTSASAKGHADFINMAFHDTTLAILYHYEHQRQQSPDDRHAINILPRWHSPVGKSWLPLLSKYKRIHSNPHGTCLFHTATFATASAAMGPTCWPRDVHLAYHTVEERQATAWNEASRSAHLKALLNESQGKECTLKINTDKSHQPRLLTEKQYITSIKYANLLLLKPTLPKHELVPPAAVMFDSGATLNFIDQNFVTSHRLPTTTLAKTNCIVMADGRITLASQSCTSTMNFSVFPQHLFLYSPLFDHPFIMYWAFLKKIKMQPRQ